MVKVLMLHGFGANAAIFEAQTAAIRALLPSHWEYHFLEAPEECGPTPGIAKVYPGQTYRCYFHVPTLTEFQSVHEFLEEVIEEEGPFDVGWGFSAGGLVITSLMLRYAHEFPHRPQPFRSAIFMNCSMPWSATMDMGKDVTPLVMQHQFVPTTLAEADRVLALEWEKNPTEADMLKDKDRVNFEDGDLIPPMMKLAYQKVFALDAEKGLDRKYSDYLARRIFAEVDKERVNIPTGHILGDVDPTQPLGTAMCDLCEPGRRIIYRHKFGHEIPTRSPRDMEKIRDVIEKTVRRSEGI